MFHVRVTVAAAVLAFACSPAQRAPAPALAPGGGSPFEAFATASPRVGEAPPGFALADSEGRPFALSDATARGPVVLIWGSFT